MTTNRTTDSTREDHPRTRVLHALSPGPPMGGMATYARGLLNSNVSRRFNLCVVRTGMVRKDRYTGIRRTLMASLNGALLSLRMLGALILVRPAIVHIQTNSGMGFYEKSFLMLLARLFGRKVVMHVHGGGFRDFHERASRGGRRIIRWLANRNHRIIVASPQMRQTFLAVGVSPEKLTLIRNAVTPPQYSVWELRDDASHGPRSAGIRVLFLNRVTIEKGLLELIDACRRLRERHPDMRVRIVGPESSDAERVREYLHPGDPVEFVGGVSEQRKAEEYRAADLYVLPSHIEDLPYGLLEAMSYGVPCVASAVGGIPSLIEDGVNGLLVQPKNVEQLAAAMDRLMCDAGLLRSLGMRARETIVSRFSWDRPADEICKVYQDLLGRRGTVAEA